MLEADFTGFNTPGEYRLQVKGLGASYPFTIGNGVAALFARTYEMGLYHQRCGFSNELPYTRFHKDACHTAFASVPTPAYVAQYPSVERDAQFAEQRLCPFLQQLDSPMPAGFNDFRQ